MDKKYRMRSNESEDDYKFRICSLKDKDGLTWQNIADILNEELGENHTESKYRKDYQMAMSAFHRGIGLSTSIKDKCDSVIFPEEFLEEKIEELEEGTEETGDLIDSHDVFAEEERMLRERYGTSAERLEFLRAIRQDSHFERFYKNVAAAIKPLDLPKYIRPIKITEVKAFDPDKEYILTLADLHLGARFESVNNSYSMNEATKRMNIVYEYMVKFIIKNDIQKIKILSLGDLIQGLLRISDVRLNEKTIVDAFVFGCRLLSDFLNKLSAYCAIDFIQVCFSNHEQLRLLGSKASELAGEDMGKILYAYLTDVLQNNKRITIYGDTEKDYIEFSIFDFNCIALHGHQVNGINNLSKDLTNRNRKFYDYVFVGHTHSAKEIINAEGESHDLMTLVSGSFCGSDPYADKLMVGSKASCKIYGFDKKYGYVESYRIILN